MASMLAQGPGGRDRGRWRDARCARVGDAYYPGYGNGGYDVARYDLDVSYDSATDRLDGVATTRATATQRLSRFNLDLVDLDVRSVEGGGRPVGHGRSAQELTVLPRHPLRDGSRPAGLDHPAVGRARADGLVPGHRRHPALGRGRVAHRVRPAPVYDAVDPALTGGLRAEFDDSLTRQGEILDLLSASFGPTRSTRWAASSRGRRSSPAGWPRGRTSGAADKYVGVKRPAT